MVVQSLLAAAPIAARIGKEGIKKGKEYSVSEYGYDFIGLITRIFIFFAIGFLIDLYFKASITGGTIFNTIASSLGLSLPSTMPEWLRKLFEEGYHGVSFWKIIQVIAILIVVMEYVQYDRKLKERGEKPNASTIGLFVLIGGALSIATIPQVIQMVKEKQIITGQQRQDYGFGGIMGGA